MRQLDDNSLAKREAAGQALIGLGPEALKLAAKAVTDLEAAIRTTEQALPGTAAALRKALELNPRHGPTHLILGLVLTRQNKLAAARDEYRLAVLYDAMLSSEEKTAALRAIAEINERLPGK